jgi:hypothetical protein
VLLVLNDLMVDAGAARVSLPCNLIFFNFFYRPERLVQYRVLYTVPGYNRAREQIASSSGTIRWFRRPHCTVPAERDLAILIYIYEYVAEKGLLLGPEVLAISDCLPGKHVTVYHTYFSKFAPTHSQNERKS